MIQQDQKICDAKNGDCLRAAIASLLEYELEAVPNFSQIPQWLQTSALKGYLWSQGYDYQDNFSFHISGGGVDSCWIASVPSRTVLGQTHAVIVNQDGCVVHDPNPNRKWLGEEVLKSNKAYYIRCIEPRDDEEWLNFLCGRRVSAGLAKMQDVKNNPLILALEKVLMLNTATGNEAALIMIRDYFA